MTILDYFTKHKSVASLQFSSPEEIENYTCNNFVIDDKLYLLNNAGRVDYIIRLDTLVDENEEGFLMHNKFYPSPITVKVFFGGVNGG